MKKSFLKTFFPVFKNIFLAVLPGGKFIMGIFQHERKLFLRYFQSLYSCLKLLFQHGQKMFFMIVFRYGDHIEYRQYGIRVFFRIQPVLFQSITSFSQHQEDLPFCKMDPCIIRNWSFPDEIGKVKSRMRIIFPQGKTEKIIQKRGMERMERSKKMTVFFSLLFREVFCIKKFFFPIKSADLSDRKEQGRKQ